MATVARAGAGYIWEDPGDSIMIQVSLDLVERLGAAVEQYAGTGSRATEIGGLLLGRQLPGRGQAVSIEDFELVPCEHLRGASYSLSPGERCMLGGRLRRRRNWQVVGFFRSHTRPGLYLDQDDYALFSNYFQDNGQVFLLVRPGANGSAEGGFFFWEDGEINRRAPYRQFPFDARRLAVGGFPITEAWSAGPPAPRPAPVPATQSVARPPRGIPQLSWLVVPVIAGLFLIAGIFVSETRDTKTAAVQAKPAPPVETLLPPPEAQVAASMPVPAQPPEVTPAAVAAAPAPRARRRIMAPPPPPVRPARAPVHTLETPPALTVPAAKLQPDLWAVLPTHATPPPPPEAETSYDVSHGGVFRRALHKITAIGGTDSADGLIPPVPTRKVAPANPPESVEEARTVDVKVFIDESGSVSRAQVLTRAGYLSAASLNAARQWHFKPARKHDKPVASEMTLHFHFSSAM